MTRIARPLLIPLALLCFAIAVPTSGALAQEKQRVAIKGAAANTKYTQQHAIDVGDISGHQVRAYEFVRTFPSDPPMVNGVKLKEAWTRGTSDYTDGTGPSMVYITYVFENDDKIFVRGAVVTQNTGTGKLTSATAGTITGGTGKFSGIQGLVRTSTSSDPKAGFNEGQTEMEYWFGK
jgi:hypothetical protein